MFGAYPGALVFIQWPQVVAGEDDLAGTGQVEAGEQTEQGLLA